ncbi:flagellar basal body P-ring formation chaperone FlgA [Massilia sp. DWR3-1-1]|uniref:flagellar basal body P-ring formation chaperone FlgA n=1 Tax=Massilia sp. DWR3-1-1 TaxID=2804559 RepID=UPI003CF0EBE5
MTKPPLLLLLTALLLATPLCHAQTPGHQDLAVLKTVAEQFLLKEGAGLPGQVTVELRPLDSRMQLAPCPAPEAFLQAGARVWGNTTVGLRCSAPTAWKVYIQAKVSVLGEYVAAAVPLAQGQPIEQSQLVMLKGDLAALPTGVVTDMGQAIGRTSTMSLPSGAPLRLTGLKSKPVVQQGQAVRVVSSGAGFKVSAEGRAIGTAGEGQVVQVRTAAGAVISGIAQLGGLVEVMF